MPPPPRVGLLKRKNQSELAGEPARPCPNNRSISSFTKAGSTAGVSRQPTFSSSTTQRSGPAIFSRNGSDSSFSSSVRPYSRPASAQAMAMQGNTLPAVTPRRPAGSFEPNMNHRQSVQTAGNRNSMTPFLSHSIYYPTPNDREKTPMGSDDNQLSCPANWWSSPLGPASPRNSIQNMRDFSVINVFEAMSLDMNDSTVSDDRNKDVQRTPSRLPRKSVNFSHVPKTSSPLKASRTIAPTVPFLSKNSNTKATAWDEQARFESMERHYGQWMEKMAEQTANTNGLQETISLYKSKSKFSYSTVSSKYLSLVQSQRNRKCPSTVEQQ